MDSAFPAGAFAHSGGIEAAWQCGALRNGEDVSAFVGEGIGQAATAALPFVCAAYTSPKDIAAIDEYVDSFFSNHVANRASRLQGMAFLATAADVFQIAELHALRQRVLKNELPGHWPLLFGVILRLLGVSLRVTLRTFIFLIMRGMLSAAVRLGIVGPLEAQRIQVALDADMERAVETALATPLDQVHQTAPLLEIWQMGQDRLYSRLFQS